MAGRDGGSGGGDKRQDSGEPEGEEAVRGQADKAEEHESEPEQCYSNFFDSTSLCQQRCVSRQSGAVSAT